MGFGKQQGLGKSQCLDCLRERQWDIKVVYTLHVHGCTATWKIVCVKLFKNSSGNLFTYYLCKPVSWSGSYVQYLGPHVFEHGADQAGVEGRQVGHGRVQFLCHLVGVEASLCIIVSFKISCLTIFITGAFLCTGWAINHLADYILLTDL